MWTIDDNGYYSNPTASYITYDNPLYFGPNTTLFELEALKSALAIAVASNRILILPSFHCCSGCVVASRAKCSAPHFRCSLLSVLRIRSFDRVFGSRYREHSFLKNRLVPDTVKRGLSSLPVLINVSASRDHSQSVDENAVELLTVTDYSHGASLLEVVRWLSLHNDTALVRFHSLYGSSVDWAADAQFGGKLQRWFNVAFDCCEYQQWDSNMLNLAKMWPGRNSTKH